MSTRSRETVLWLTLVDFLLQVVLLGVFAFTVYYVGQAANVQPQLPPAFVELTNRLTRLVPAEQVGMWLDGI